MTRCNGRHSQTPQLKIFPTWNEKSLSRNINKNLSGRKHLSDCDVVLVCVEQVKVICACWLSAVVLCARILFWLSNTESSQLRGEKIPAPNLKLPGISDFYFQADMKFLPNYLDLNQLRLGEYIDHLLI